MGRQPAGLTPHPPSGSGREVLVLELLTSRRGAGWYDRHVKLPNFAGVMAQTVAVWVRQLGYRATYRTWTGNEPLAELLEGEWAVVFVSSYTRTAYAAYALAGHFARRGAVTVLGGPHATAYAADALRYFDYVLGLTDRELVARVLDERRSARGAGGRWLSAAGHPPAFPTLAERDPFLRHALAKARWIRSVPMLASVGCPYRCAFCSDAETAFRALSPEALEEDIRYARRHHPRALLFWHDPNFGVRFDATLDAIERGLGTGRLRFGAESSLSLLTPEHTCRLASAGFVALLPALESWDTPDPKLGIGRLTGRARLLAAVERLGDVVRRIPYVQVNFIFGLEREGPEAFELTDEFVRRVPGAWPNFNLLTAYGRASPLGRRLEEEGRILAVPYPLLDQKTCPNVRLAEADDGCELFERLVRLCESALGIGQSVRRALAARSSGTLVLNLLRAWGHEQRTRLRWYRRLHGWLRTDHEMRRFFTGRTARLPVQLRALARARTGPFAPLLPPDLQRLLDTGWGPSVEPEPAHASLME